MPTEILTPVVEPGAADPSAGTLAAPETTEVPPLPTIRWGALVWALIFGTIAGVTLWSLANVQHRDDALAWMQSIPMSLLPLYGLLAIGVVVVLFGIVGLIRRGERRRRLARG